MKTNTALDKIANADIRMARKHGSIIIAQTKRGNVTLARTEIGLEISGAEITPTGEVNQWSIAGKVGLIRQTLCDLYQVEVIGYSLPLETILAAARS